MRLRFSKMHHLGEDLIVIDGLTQHVRLTGDMVRFLADRRLGAGCQQVLVVEAPSRPEIDFRGRLFNRDGSASDDYYHAVYCLARFVWERRLTARQRVRVETVNGPTFTLEAQADGQVTVDLGVPGRKSADEPNLPTITQQLDLGDQYCDVTTVDLDQQHAIVTLPSVADAPLKSLGRRIQQHQLMAASINVGFMAVLSSSEIDLRVLRHSGSEARACPSGAIAAVLAGRHRGLLDENVTVKLPGGSLNVHWQGEGSAVRATSLATMVFQGQIHL